MGDQTLKVQKLGQTWATAELRGDGTSLREVLAEDFVGVGPRGFMLTKEQWLSRHETGSLGYKSFALNEMQVRLYGDAAITVCRPERGGSVRGRERSLRHQRAISRYARLREAGWALAAGRSTVEPHPGQALMPFVRNVLEIP